MPGARARVDDPWKNPKERLEEMLCGKRELRRREREAELEHEHQLAAIQLETERKLAEIRKGDGTASVPQSPAAEPVPSRRAFVEPILAAKGWSILDWANEANVSYHAATDYLSGTRRSYSSTRAKLAKALGVSVQHLPK